MIYNYIYPLPLAPAPLGYGGWCVGYTGALRFSVRVYRYGGIERGRVHMYSLMLREYRAVIVCVVGIA